MPRLPIASLELNSVEEKKVTVIIPCYRSENHLKRTVGEILAVLSAHSDLCLTVVLINDASPDRTAAVIRDLVYEHPKTVVGLSLKRNVGQARAKMAGLPYVDEGYAIFMDDDGQHDPHTIFDMIRKVDCGFDLVYARFEELEESAYRRVASGVIDSLLWLFAAKPRGLRITSYFALSPTAAECLQTYKSLHPFIGGYLMRRRFSVGTVPSNHRARSTGKSSYSMRKLCMRAAELCFLWRLPLRDTEEAMYEVETRYEA